MTKKIVTAPLNVNGTIYSSGDIKTAKQFRKDAGSSWIAARDNAAIRNNNGNSDGGYHPILSQKTTNGEWSIGHLSGEDNLTFSYTTDTNYNNKNNTSVRWTLSNTGVFGGKASTAGTADKLGSSTIGGTTQPIYLNNGTPTAGTALSTGAYRNVIADASDKTHTNFPNNNTLLPSMQWLSYWNGAYSSGNASNLTYAHQGTIQCKPTSLYDNATGSNGTITLSQTAANFTRMTIYFKDQEGNVSSHIIYSPNGKTVPLNLSVSNTAYANLWVKTRSITISGTSISTKSNIYLEAQVGTSMAMNHTNLLYIYKVEGWK